MTHFHASPPGSPSLARAWPRLLMWALLGTTCLPPMAHAASCAVEISDSVVDYGRVARAELLVLESGGRAALGERMVTVLVKCENPQRMGLAIDADSARMNEGHVEVAYRVADAQLDGEPVQLVSSRDPEKIVSVLVPGDRVQTRAPERGKVLAVRLEVDTRVSTASNWMTHRGKWEDSAVFQAFTPQVP